MGCYKEADHLFNDYYKAQEQIYDDACDIGIPVEGPEDHVCHTLCDIFSDSKGWKGFLGGIKKHRKVEKFSNGTIMYSVVTVCLPWENVEGTRDLYNCTKWEIVYHNDPNKRKQFISFTPCHYVAYKTEIWEGDE